MRKTLYILLFLLIIGCNKKEYPKTVFDSKKETELLIKEFLKDFAYIPNVTESSKGVDLLECFKDLETDRKFFTSKELNYLKVELAIDSLKKWTAKDLPNVNLISDDTIRSKGKFKFIEESEVNLFTFSHPIFFRNGKYCIFYEEYKCSMICGGATLYLFEKKGSNWEIIRKYCEWIN